MSAGTVVLEADILAASTGDRVAFARLIDGSRSLVCSIALAVVSDLELSRDVAQEVYVAVWRDLKRLRKPASFLPWLRQLTRNKAHEALRSRVRYRRRIAEGADEDLESASDPAADIVGNIVSHEERDLLSKAIAELPDASRDVVILFYQEDHSVRHVADLLGISEDAVKQRLSRAREVLRETLAEKLGGLVAKVKPSSGFTAAVLAMLPLGQPKTAAAASLASVAKPVSGALKAAATASLGGLLGAVTGFVGSLLGVFSDYRAHAALLQTERQRRQLHWFSLAQLLIAPAMMVVLFRWPTLLGALTAMTGVIAGYGVTRRVWLPRIIGTRSEVSRVNANRHFAWAVLGAIFGFGGIAVAWYLSR